MSLRTPLVFFNFPPNLTPSCIHITLSHLVVGTSSGPSILFHISEYKNKNTIQNEGNVENSENVSHKLSRSDSFDQEGSLDWVHNSKIDSNRAILDEYDPDNNKPIQPFSVMHGHESKVTAITSCIYDYSNCAVTLSIDGTLCIWNLTDGRCMAIETYLLNSEPTCCCVLPGKQSIVVAGQTQIEIVDLEKLRVIRVLEGHTEWIQTLDNGLLPSLPDTEKITTLLSVGRDTCVRYWTTKNNGEWNQEPSYEYISKYIDPVMICHSANWNIIVLVTEKKWMIYQFHNQKPLFEIDSPEGKHFRGAKFVSEKHLFLYTDEGIGLLYELPEIDSQGAIQIFKETQRLNEELDQKEIEHTPTIFISSINTETPQSPLPSNQNPILNLSIDENHGKGAFQDIKNSVFNVLRRKRSSISLTVDTMAPAKSIAQKSTGSIDSLLHEKSLSFNESPLFDPQKKNGANNLLLTPPITPVPNLMSRSLPSFGDILENESELHLTFDEDSAQGPKLITTINVEDSELYENQYLWSVCKNFICRGDSKGNFKIWSIHHFLSNNKDTTESTNSLEIHDLGDTNLTDGWPSEYVNQQNRVTSSHFMLDKDRAPKLIHGMSDGTISIMPSVSTEKVHQFKAHDSKVTALLVCHDSVSDQRILISGSQDGSIKIWEMSTEETILLKTFYVHSESVTMLFIPPDSIRKKLSNGFVSIGDDRSVVFFSLKRMEVVHILGGHSSDVATVFWRPDLDYVLVRCTDGYVYVWHFSTGLLERRLGGLVAHELIDQAQGVGCSIRVSSVLGYSRKATFAKKQRGFLESCSLIISDDEPEIQLLILSVRRTIGYINSKLDSIRQMLIHHSTEPTSYALTSALGYILQYGKSNALELLRKTLHIETCYPQAFIGLKGAGDTFSLIVPKASVKSHPFKFSPILSASYTISCVSILNALSKIPELEKMCHSSRSYYLKDMPHDYHNFEEPSFLFCAQYLKDSSKEVQDAARATMIAVLNRMKHESAVSLAEKLANLLLDNNANLFSSPRKQNVLIALAILACHNANAIEGRIASLTTRGLIDIMENGGSQQITAIQLLGEAYHIWKYYLSDSLIMFKMLFNNAMESLSATGSDPSTNIGQVSETSLESFARISSIDPKSFVDFCLELLNNPNESPPVMVYAALSSIETVIELYPECLISYLQVISSLVLKTLDRNFPQVRNASLGIGRKILRMLVETYPMVTYHQTKQRFAIGNTEGSIIIFDLKTTSKSQQINAHKGPIASIAISPQGNMIASYAPMDFSVRLWNLEGTGLFSLMGVATRALKTYTLNNLNPNFNVIDTLKTVKIEWNSEQTHFVLYPGPNMNPVKLSVK